ncbi:MAG TPA: ankyrin repeat domain-containing protein [Bryobacteraceae bacterium]|jgi:ankyrin repeat protein|nr:ankyrin repeat domain-containing protein [Bryobacteraceae bacterium]
MKLTLCLLALTVHSLHAEVSAATEMLTKACRLGDTKTAESLLAAGVNPDLPDRYGATPLYYAASFNHTEIVQLLLEYHADPNAPVSINERKDGLSSTALQYAARSGNLRITSILIAAGARVNTKGAEGRTALHFAGGQVGIIHLLIEKGADVNARDAEGIAPLDDEVWGGSLDAVAILLAHGAQLNEVEPKTGATPINEAAYRGNTPIVQYLLQFKPDLEVPDNRGNTPLENAIRTGKEDCALLLLEAEAIERKTPQFLEKTMDAAVKKDEPALVETLLRRGVPLNGTLPSGSTPLGTAVFAGAVMVVCLLLKSNADPNISSRDGTSPLQDASLKGSDTIAGMLLDHGALVNYINSGSGTTALYTAASFGRVDVVKLLLSRGANPNLCGTNRRSPYQAALENGNHDVADQIQIHGGAEGCK